MKIELKKIKFSESLSEETNAYTADVYADGKLIGHARNSGQGGPTDIYPNDQEALDIADAYCKTLPSVMYGHLEIKKDLEFVVDELLEAHLKAKDQAKLDKKMKGDFLKGICFKTPNGYSLISWGKFSLENLLNSPIYKPLLIKAILKLQSEGKVILNDNLPKELSGDPK